MTTGLYLVRDEAITQYDDLMRVLAAAKDMGGWYSREAEGYILTSEADARILERMIEEILTRKQGEKK